jgi:hypothetical protein
VYWVKNVGGAVRRFDLPPMRECQLVDLVLTHCNRGQAPSHIWISTYQLELGLLLLWLLILISGAPLTTLAERRLESVGNPAGRRPTDSSLRSGIPSLGEVPSGGARALWLLWGFSKVTRRKGGTVGSRYRSNGYVLGQIQRHGRPRGRHGTKPPHHQEISQLERQTR